MSVSKWTHLSDKNGVGQPSYLNVVKTFYGAVCQLSYERRVTLSGQRLWFPHSANGDICQGCLHIRVCWHEPPITWGSPSYVPRDTLPEEFSFLRGTYVRINKVQGKRTVFGVWGWFNQVHCFGGWARVSRCGTHGVQRSHVPQDPGTGWLANLGSLSWGRWRKKRKKKEKGMLSSVKFINRERYVHLHLFLLIENT